MGEHIGRSNGDAGGGRLSADDAAQLTGQIADLTRAGLPLPSGLRALGEEVSSRRLRRTLDGLAHSLEAGSPIEQAIAEQGKRLPGHLRGLVQVGARTGRIGEVFARFAGYTNIRVQLRRYFWLRVAKPLFATLFSVALLVFVCVSVIGQFRTIFKDFGLPVPLLTRLLFAMSDVLTVAWWPLLEGIAVLVAAWCVVNGVIGAPARRSLASLVPLVGPVVRWTSLSEFCHLLGLLLESELALPEALPLAGEGVQDAQIMGACRVMAERVEAGEDLATVFDGRSVFPKGIGRILSWAGGHRSLAEALHMAGDMFEARARAQASFAGTVLGVLSVIIILGGIGLIIPAIFLPMINLIQKLSG